MNINMNLYTKRERNLLAGLSPMLLQNSSITIDPLKVKVSELFPEDEWDMWYFRCMSVGHALVKLSEYQPGLYVGKWVWYVPRTPTFLYLDADDTRSYIRTVATPSRLERYLELIHDRPRNELRSIVEVLKQVLPAGILEIDMVSADRPGHYWELSWTCARFENRNVIYIKR